jgi:F0F1-type ATP synthase assembly protein I
MYGWVWSPSDEEANRRAAEMMEKFRSKQADNEANVNTTENKDEIQPDGQMHTRCLISLTVVGIVIFYILKKWS